ncbi:hypothetical protein [Vibrio aerogenes]|uniref:hypothetical protein n=1 Tax=Vibrio aerogenes TaxID=92172 RepID=UPI0021C484B4|nr:hypothetical protein [Vibrio aerogenes]
MNDGNKREQNKHREKATVHIQTKLTASEYEPFKIIIETTGIKKSELFRSVLLANNYNIILSDRHGSDKTNLLSGVNLAIHYLNEISAHLVSVKNKSQISEKYFIQAMNRLISLEKQFIACLEQC